MPFFKLSMKHPRQNVHAVAEIIADDYPTAVKLFKDRFEAGALKGFLGNVKTPDAYWEGAQFFELEKTEQKVVKFDWDRISSTSSAQPR